MSRIFVTNPVAGPVYQIDVGGLAEIIKGTSIVSIADSDRYIEFGLSENLMIRIERGEGEHITSQQVSVFSTLNADEISPVRVQLINDDEVPSLELVEFRLNAVRQVYAIALLLESGRQDDLAAALRNNPHMDIERELLGWDERLAIEGAGTGSLWALLTTITKRIQAAPQAALNTLSLVYGEGRTMMLQRVRASTNTAVANAAGAQIAVGVKADERVLKLVEALEKTKDPDGRAIILSRLRLAMSETNSQIAGPIIAGYLTGPETS